MKDQRGAVIDHPEIAVPHQQIRVLRRAVDVRHQRVEPDDRRGQALLAAQRAVDERVERDRPRQVIEADVHPLALLQQLLDLGVGLGPGHPPVELHEHDLGHGQPERAGDLAGDQLRRERAHALARAAELHDVRAVIVGADDGRERAAFAQRRHVLGRGDGADHRRRSCTIRSTSSAESSKSSMARSSRMCTGSVVPVSGRIPI